MQEVISQWIGEYWPDETLGNVLLSRGFIVLWCSLIVLYFLICTSWLIKNAIPLLLALKKAIKRLDGFQGEEEFFKRFETYDTWIKGQKRLNHVWCEFTESLVFPPPGSGATVIQNTAEPAEFLNEATILGRNIARRFFQSVPSHLTAGGILGTFLGLAAGIGVAATGLTSGNQEAVTNALGNLLHGASLAFVTSIFGIFFSLVFLVTYRFLISMVLRAQDRWVFTLEGRLRLITPERVALDQLHESQRQTKQLERFNDELVFSIEKALEEKIAQKLTPQLSALVAAVSPEE